MFKVKRGGWFFASIMVVLLIFYGDFHVTKQQEADQRDRINGYDIMGAFADRVQPGMTRQTAESMIQGFRRISIFEADGETTVVYRYWYGFIPPLPVLRYKILGKLSVTYSSSGQVVDVRHWYS